MLDQYKSKLVDVDVHKIQDFTDPVQAVYYLTSLGVSYYANLNDSFDYDSPRWGIRGGDMVDYIRSLVMGSAPNFDKDGNKIVGMFQGKYFSTTDAMQSQSASRLHSLVAVAKNNIAREFNQEQALIVGGTNKYYDAIGRSTLQEILIGESDKYHEVFYEKHNGKITHDYQFKNPWDNNSSLDNHQRAYLKQKIFELYKFSKANLGSDIKTLAEFEKHEGFQQILAEGKIFKAPLVKRIGASKWKTLTTDGFRKTIGRTWEDTKGLLDPRDLSEEDRATSYKTINGFKQMYNQFDQSSNDDSYRNSLIDKHGVGYFEMNLDTIALKYAFESIRERHFNAVLPMLHSAVTVMKYHG